MTVTITITEDAGQARVNITFDPPVSEENLKSQAVRMAQLFLDALYDYGQVASAVVTDVEGNVLHQEGENVSVN